MYNPAVTYLADAFLRLLRFDIFAGIECPDPNPCKNGSSCVNAFGGYQCHCPIGQEYDYQNNLCQGKFANNCKN